MIKEVLKLGNPRLYAKSTEYQKENIKDCAILNGTSQCSCRRKGKNLWTANGSGDKIVLNTLEDEYSEGKFISDEIMKQMN